jgi:hypothetical protein
MLGAPEALAVGQIYFIGGFMKKEILLIVALISLLISSCGPGQLLGPTITPSMTNLPPTMTFTPSPTPVSLETILSTYEFTKATKPICIYPGTCSTYDSAKVGMSLEIHENGTVEIRRAKVSINMTLTQEIIFGVLLKAIYPNDIATQLFDVDMNNEQYIGNVSGYTFNKSLLSHNPFDVIIVVISPA